jgi:hypothetical protein
MKSTLGIIALFFLFLGCKKSVEPSLERQPSLTVSSDALVPLPCHSTAFSTAYATSPGKVPPFYFTKTLYADTRVKTIQLFSRANPNFNHPMYGNWAYELKGSFSYSTNAAKFVGTKETWEYFKTSTGVAGKRSLGKLSVTYNFVFNAAGLCTSVSLGTWRVLKLNYTNPGLPNTLSSMIYSPNSEETWPITVTIDSKGNPTKIINENNVYVPYVTYKYDYSRAGDRYNYQPSQYGVNFEYSLLEVMQWVPLGKNPRSGVAVSFIGVDANESLYRVTQSQIYKNMKYDSKRNLVSYTYGDNVLQKTTWYCK